MRILLQTIVLRRLLPTLAVAALLAPPALAQGSKVVLGADGTVTRLLSGTYHDLFVASEDSVAEGEAVDTTAVLALEEVAPDGTVERWLIPGTEDWEVERPASLVLDDPSGARFALWESSINGLHPLLRLVRFEEGTFSSVLDITSGAFADKGAARVLITQEHEAAVRVDESEEDGDERTVVHISWWQESALGSLKLYAPVVIEGGELQQHPPIFDLSGFFPAIEGEEAEPMASEALQDLLTARRSETSQSLVLGFLDSTSQRIKTVRMDIVPRVLTLLGDKLPAEIVIIGLRSGNRTQMAKAIGPELESASWLHPSVRQFLQGELEATVEQWPGELQSAEGLEALAAHLEEQILRTGAGVEAGGLASGAVDMVDAAPATEGPRQVLTVRPLSSRPAPEIGTPEGAVRFFLSSSGFHALVAWEEEGRVYFRETLEDGWGEIGSLEPLLDLDTAAIYRMLEERVAER